MAEYVNVVVTVVMGPGAAELRERFEVKTESTLEDTLKILRAFHELSEQIRDNQAGIRKG